MARRRIVLRTLGILVLQLAFGQASAGGGPETTLLVVNADSPLSHRIANEYARLRDIPPTHMVWLDGIDPTESITIKEFRQKIWNPIRTFIEHNELDEEIDAIIYSADFPYAVKFASDLKAARKPKNKYLGTTASLTALTYFARRVAVGDLGYLGRNYYFRDLAGLRKRAVYAPENFSKLTEKEVGALMKESRKALQTGETDIAIANYRKLVDAYPRSPHGWHDLARGLAAAGKTDEAMKALSSAVDTGWMNSLETRRDLHLKSLASHPGFGDLIGRMDATIQAIQQPRGFRNHYVWSNADLMFWEQSDFRNQYFLSMMLAYTSGIRGNSFPEVMNYLHLAAKSDGTHPDGTVYLMENNNIRSKTRQPLFTTTLKELSKRERRAEILGKHTDGQNGVLPVGKSDIIGLVVGSPSFSWNKSGSQLLPGAIAESLTSYGGILNSSGQTKLTEFLRRGAAGSSGAVAEPFALQRKFPVPMMHGYYADGVSLAEAFYQSIEFPYQLLIVGDPLARPFANFADVELSSPDPEQPWTGIVALQAVVKAAGGHPVKAVELWIDGQFHTRTSAGETIELDTQQLVDGTHQLRLVAVEDSAIETRSYARVTIQVENDPGDILVDAIGARAIYGDPVEVSGTAPTGARISLYQGYRALGSSAVENGKWTIRVPGREIGPGPVILRTEATLSDGRTIRGSNIELSIETPPAMSAASDKPPANKGLRAIIHDSAGARHEIAVEKLKGRIRVEGRKGLKAERVTLDGYFKIPDTGFYQLVIATRGQIKLRINGRLLLDEKSGKSEQISYIPLSLKSGWHQLHLELEGARQNYPTILLAGDQVPGQFGRKNTGH